MSPTLWHPAADDEGNALVARAYGLGLSDLLVEFERPLDDVINTMLSLCLSNEAGAAFDIADVTHWTIVKRRQGLLAIAVATNGQLRWLTAECSACHESLDMDVDLTRFQQDWRMEEISFGATQLRLPRPQDLSCVERDENQLARVLLIGDPPLGSWEAEAEEVLDAADPLANLELQAVCPECQAAVLLPLLLETYLVEELAIEFTRLLDEIHTLALAYHWSEPEIIALPESRRRHYLSRISEAWTA